MLYAEGCPGPGLKTAFRNDCPAHCAESVSSTDNPLKSGLDLLQSGAALLKQGRGLGKLKSYGAAFRIMLIVGIGVLSGRTHRADILAKCVEENMLAVALLLEKDSEPLHIDHGLQDYRDHPGTVEDYSLRQHCTMSAGTTRHTIRIEDQLWKEAHAKATRDGTTVSELIRAGLSNYVSGTEASSLVPSRHTLADSLAYLVPDALYDLQGPSPGMVELPIHLDWGPDSRYLVEDEEGVQIRWMTPSARSSIEPFPLLLRFAPLDGLPYAFGPHGSPYQGWTPWGKMPTADLIAIDITHKRISTACLPQQPSMRSARSIVAGSRP